MDTITTLLHYMGTVVIFIVLFAISIAPICLLAFVWTYIANLGSTASKIPVSADMRTETSTTEKLLYASKLLTGLHSAMTFTLTILICEFDDFTWPHYEAIAYSVAIMIGLVGGAVVARLVILTIAATFAIAPLISHSAKDPGYLPHKYTALQTDDLVLEERGRRARVAREQLSGWEKAQLGASTAKA